MANLVCTANGNFTTAATWAVCDANSVNDSEATFTTLTTGNTDSSTFTPAAVAIDAVLVKIAARASGSPTNTISITLRNNTTATNIATVTVNVSDLKACDTTNREGGWYIFKLGATHTPNGTDTYLIRATLSSTSTSVSLWVSSGTNLTRMCRTTTTQAPAAADRMIIAKEMTAAATSTARSVTMNNTASTTFGSATGLSTTNWQCAAINIGNGGTLTWGTTAATNYFLSLTGSIVAHSGATWTIGDSGAEIPADSTAIIEFVMSASADSRIGSLGDATTRMYGLPRTPAKVVTWCSLTADVAAAATSISVDADTGWKNGDTIAIASTTRTSSEAETKTLSADAGASSMSVAALTNAHKGSQAIFAEVILLTRNIWFRSNNSARQHENLETTSGANVICSWVRFQHGGGSGTSNGPFGGTTGSNSTQYLYCAFDEWGVAGNPAVRGNISTGTNNFTVNHCVFYTSSGNAGPAINITSLTNSNWTVNDCVCVRNNQTLGFQINSQLGTTTNLRVSGAANQGISFAVAAGTTGWGTNNTWTCHSNGSVGIQISASVPFGFNLHTLTSYRNNAQGISYVGDTGIISAGRIDTWISFGNTTDNISFSNIYGMLTGANWVVAGDTSFSTAEGALFSPGNNSVNRLILEGPVFGAGGDTKTTHTTRDILVGSNASGLMVWMLDLIGPTLASAVEAVMGTFSPKEGSYIRITRPDGALAGTKTEYAKIGTVAYETSTVQASTASQKLTPSISTAGTDHAVLRSGAKRVAVDSGQTVTMSVYARKDGSYNGSIQPRLVVLANAAMGISSDTVLDTLSVGANTWEQLSGTTAAVSDKGVLEFVVECNGTAGNAFCDTWAAS